MLRIHARVRNTDAEPTLEQVATEHREIGNGQAGAAGSSLRPRAHEESKRIPMVLDPKCPPPEIAKQEAQVGLRIALRDNAEFCLGLRRIQRHLSSVQPIGNEWLRYTRWHAASGGGSRDPNRPASAVADRTA